MDFIKKRLDKRPVMSRVVKYLLIAIGSAVGAVGFQFFMQPNSIVSGGLTGIAQIINRLTGAPVGVLSIVMNVPLFVIAWKKFGSEFIIGSFVGTVFYSVFIDFAAMTNIVATNDPMLGSIIGGVVKGIGLGMSARRPAASTLSRVFCAAAFRTSISARSFS